MEQEKLAYIKLLRSRSLKATSHRLLLLQTMQEYGSAIPYSSIQESMKLMDRVTLYRTLSSLADKGIIHKAAQSGNETYYAICEETCAADHHTHDHLHFKCVSCDTITCEKPSNNIEIKLPEFAIHNVSITMEGLCRTCNK